MEKESKSVERTADTEPGAVATGIRVQLSRTGFDLITRAKEARILNPLPTGRGSVIQPSALRTYSESVLMSQR